MKRATTIACVAAAGAVLGLAAPASATTFCVPSFHAGCPNDGTNVAQANVETAMGTSGTDGVADTVILDADTITNADSIIPVGSDPLTVRGAGADATILTTTDNTNAVVVDLWGAGVNTRNVTMRDLEIAVPASMPDDGGVALQMSNDLVEDARIISRNPSAGSGSNGVIGFLDGGTIRRTTFTEEAGGKMSRAIESFPADSGTILLEDLTIDSPASAISMSDPGGTVTARRIRIATPEQSPFSASAGTLIVENSVVYADSSPGLSVTANSDANATLIADHVTAVNVGAFPNVASVAANTAIVGSDGDSNITVTNSIFRGFNTGVQRQVFPGTTGPANATVRYSNIDSDTSETGAGAITLANNNDADPDFISLFDLRLEPGSPSIDAGDPAAGGLASDLDGIARPQDGDDNGSVIRDQGAYELPDPTPPIDPPPGGGTDTTPPETTIDSGPGKRKKLRKRRAAFGFSSTEAGSTFECRVVPKPFSSCTSPTKRKRLKRGKRKFEVRAIDAAGNVDQTPASKRFKVPRKKRQR